MKILQVLPVFILGGVETMCENLSVELKKAGHEVRVLSLFTQHTPISDRLEEKGIEIRYLDKKKGFDRAVFGRVKNELRSFQPDVVHTHIYTAKYAQPAASRLGVPALVHTVCTVAEHEFGRPDRMVNKYLYRHKGVIPVALSDEIQKSVAELYSLNADDIPIVLNGVPLENCRPVAAYPEKAVRFLHIGRFSPEKNHALLIRAFAKLHEKLPDARLDLYGEGALLGECKALAAELQANDYIRFCGTLPSLYDVMHEADVFLLPSVYEGVPMTLIEAMGTGLPCIASRVGGIPDMITDGVNGLLIEPTEEALEAAMLHLAGDKALRQRLGEAAGLRSEAFSAKLMAEKYIEIYKKALAKSR